MRTEYSKIEELKIELKGQAVAKARTQAEEMVNVLGQKLGPAIFISDLTMQYPERDRSDRYFNRVIYFDLENEEAIPTQPEIVEFEKLKVEATVKVHFSLIQ